MPVPRTTRSGRTIKNSSTNQSKLDALELLARQRRGEKVDYGIKEDEPLFDEVNEEEYLKTKKGGFIVDRTSDDEELDSDMDDFIDEDGDDDDDKRERVKKLAKSKDKGKRKPRGLEKNEDPTQRSVRSLFGAAGGSSRSKPSFSNEPDKNKAPINEDEILSQMLYSVPTNPTSAAKKPIKIGARTPTVASNSSHSSSSTSRAIKTRASLEPVSVKRPRMASQTLDNEPEDFAPSSSAADWPDDFEDSMPFPEAKNGKTADKSLKQQQQVVPMEDLDDDQESKITVNDATEIKATPLNDDLRSNLEFHDYDQDKKYTHFYWFDCCEDQVKNPGVVYFFGRIYATTIKKYVSCCTMVKNIKKTNYLLIKDNCTFDEVVGEFTHIIAKRYKIRNFTCNEVDKKYAFSTSQDQTVPLLAKYVQVDYPANQALPSDLTGETFSKILNVNQTPMERLILNLKLRGPCWFKLVEPVAPSSQLTWTRIELVLESPDNLKVETAEKQAPYFCAFSLALKTYANPITHQNEIISIAGMYNTAFNLDECLKKTNKASGHFMIMSKPAAGHKELRLPYDFETTVKRSYRKTRFELLESERDLLTTFLDKFMNLDPDLVIGHDLINFDYETLVVRMKHLKVGDWSKLGRFRRTELPSTKAAFKYLFSGRSICDIRTSAMELIHARSYDLNELCLQVLQKNRAEYNQLAIVDSYKSSSDKLIQLIHSTWEDADNIFSILAELNVIPLALKITNITGNILSRTLSAGRSERNEYLLLHAFHEENFICPEKLNVLSNHNKFNKNKDQGELAPTRKKAAYSGGLVLDPKTGYYDNCVLLMDFNSLYPSIIQEFNICFSTVKIPESLGPDDNSELIASVPENSVATGVLPTQLRNLVDGRRRVKRLIADPKTPADKKLLLDIEQKALKLTANSMYGCLGFEQSRFYAKHLASLVTFKGREILMSTKAAVESLGYEVIYGDTDSLMINTKLVDYDQVIEKGNEIKADVNRTFKLLEIDIDGVYRPLLLLKKKNYAGASIKKAPDGKTLVKSIETKGLDTVRRDRAVIAKEAGEQILSMILACDKDIALIVDDIHNYLKTLGDRIRANEMTNEKFLISKQLNRNPEEYRDTKGIGHVTLALRHNKNPSATRKMKSGDTVEYLICLDETGESANQRAYTIEELKNSNGKLQIDYEYYLCQQIHPVMVRICDKLPTTSAYTLAEMLGIEKSNLLHIRRDDSDAVKKDQLLSEGQERFNKCDSLFINCPNCNLPNEYRKKLKKSKDKDKKIELALQSCTHCNFRLAIKSKLIITQVLLIIKRLMLQLFNTKYVCENADCNHETRNAFCPLVTNSENNEDEKVSGSSQIMCDLCESPMQPEWDDKKVDLHLKFYKSIFDLRDLDEESKKNSVDVKQVLETLPEDVLEMYGNCFKEFEYALKGSFINNIDAFFLFSMICSGR